MNSFTAVFNINNLAAGPHSITATYVSSNGEFSGSSSPVALEAVNKITPMIHWQNLGDIVYGTKLSTTQLNATATDEHNGGEPISGTFAYTPDFDTLLDAGSRNLMATFTPNDTATYTSQTATVTINVTKATLTASSDDASRNYGADNPPFTFQYSGFVNNESAAVVTTSPTCNTTATPTSNVGHYPIACSGGASANYKFSYVNGTLNVTPAALMASVVGDPTKPYDGNATATLTPANFLLSRLVGSDSVTITKTSGTYNSADVASANRVTANLAAGDFSAGAGTLLTNYMLPASASGPATLPRPMRCSTSHRTT